MADWLQERPDERYQAIDCTLVFADISGFTRMTEMLAGQGKAGAEEMAGLINSTFRPLLEAAYAYGAGLIKWGGDATLLLFHGADHAVRACRAAGEMQRAMRALGTRQTSRGPLRLRMSIGASSGTCDFFLVGGPDHRELLVLGDVATALTQMEKLADAGQIVISPATAEELTRAGERAPTARAGDGWLLRHLPSATSGAFEYGERDPRLLFKALSPILRESILADALESEHRYVTAGFVQFSGTDRLLAQAGPQATADAVDHVIQVAQAAALENEVTFLATDIGPDGGKVMLAAGAPKRRGGDERRMAATLRSIVQAADVLSVSAGATVGRSFCGDYGPPHRRTYSLMGDCVNLAARLMAHAPDGKVLLSAGLVEALDGAFQVEPQPPFAAKGKRLPVRPFSLGAPTAVAPAVAREQSPLIGRETELATLLEVAESVRDGAGAVLDLVGDPGMGKSRLLSELEARTSARVVWTQGEVYAASRPYAAFEPLIRQILRVPEDASPETLAERLAEHALIQAPELLPWLPLIGVVAGLELPATKEVEQTEASLRKERLEELTSQLLARILTTSTVLILNDVHLMDDASRELIRRLAADAADRPWLVLSSRRPDFETLLEEVPHSDLHLGPLTDEAAAQLLALATVDSPLPPHRLTQLAERAQGNPLFLRELSAQLSQGGDLETLPSSVEEAIAARIDRLEASDRRVLRAAAVLGMDVGESLLKEVLEPELSRLKHGVRLGALGEFLEPTGPDVHRFSHQLIREVAYEALPYGRRSELHARTATAIRRLAGSDADSQAELLSLHCFHGQQYDLAWRYSQLAAERARARYGNVEAAESFRRALAAGGHLRDLEAAAMANVESELADVCLELGEPAEAETALRRALGRVRDQPLIAARMQLGVARVREMCGQYRGALQWLARAERTLRDLDGPDFRALRAQLGIRHTRINFRLGRHENAMSHAEIALATAREAGELLAVAEALEFADLSAMELGDSVGDRVREALAIYQELGALGAEARAHNTLGMMAYHRGSWAEALERYQAAEGAYTRSGARWSAAMPAANSAEILADQGRLDDAQDGLERAMLVWRSVNAASDVAFGNYQLGRIAARQGRGPEAMSRLRAAREHFEGTGELNELVVVDAFMAESLCLAGDHESAVALAEETLGRVRSLGGMAAVTPLLNRVRGVSLLALARSQEGEEALREALEAARARAAGHEIAFALKTLVDANVGRDEVEEQDWRQELAMLSSGLGLDLDGMAAAPGRAV
ncbi:MAG TPA: AAA family ATPase [Solirubrobacteraceae bacterium]|nr:AAA family ATPase [Solirubrobacteraceae bacterium]